MNVDPSVVVSCPACNAGNTAGDAFCTACGKALAVAGGGPRIASCSPSRSGRDDLRAPASGAAFAIAGSEAAKTCQSEGPRPRTISHAAIRPTARVPWASGNVSAPG